MRILGNIDSNHYHHVKNLLDGADELRIVSPFLMESFDVFFHDIRDTGIRKVTLTTTLKDNSPDLFKKANSLHSFCLNCATNQLDFSVHIDNKLHGKVYVALKNDVPLRGIVTSSNFTEAGLAHNHEWGITVDDVSLLSALIREIESVSSRTLTVKELTQIVETIDEYEKHFNKPTEPPIDLVLSNIYHHDDQHPNASSIFDCGKRFFIKPVGWSDRPFSTSRVLASDIENLHFSKRRPSSVRVGDILICYGVGTRKLLGYFEAIEEPVFLENGDRWPWEIKARNLCSDYSVRWNTFNNTISSIRNSYDSEYPITYVGGTSLGALNFGADKIRITEQFARHAISLMEESIRTV